MNLHQYLQHHWSFNNNKIRTYLNVDKHLITASIFWNTFYWYILLLSHTNPMAPPSSQPPPLSSSSNFPPGQYDPRDSRRLDSRMKERDRREREAAEYKRRRSGPSKDIYVRVLELFKYFVFIISKCWLLAHLTYTHRHILRFSIWLTNFCFTLIFRDEILRHHLL